MAPKDVKKSVQAAPPGEWRHLDAKGVVLGRLASRAAHLLMGKHRPDFAPHIISPVFLIITNAASVRVTGDKLKQKTYYHFSGYPGGLKHRTLAELMELDPRRVIEAAVYGMLPKNSLRDKRMKHLKVYPGSDHPHSNL